MLRVDHIVGCLAVCLCTASIIIQPIIQSVKTPVIAFRTLAELLRTE